MPLGLREAREYKKLKLRGGAAERYDVEYFSIARYTLITGLAFADCLLLQHETGVAVSDKL